MTLNRDLDENTDELMFYEEPEMVTVRGRTLAGWTVAVFDRAVRVITLSAYSVFGDGSVSEPDITRYVEDGQGKSVHPESRGEQPYRILEQLRSHIATTLEELGITVLPETERCKEVPGRRSQEEVFSALPNEPALVLDAFFFGP